MLYVRLGCQFNHNIFPRNCHPWNLKIGIEAKGAISVLHINILDEHTLHIEIVTVSHLKKYLFYTHIYSLQENIVMIVILAPDSD